MKKTQITGFLLFMITGLMAQFNNEWIDYSKTYYKIKTARSGIYRISKNALDVAGIGNIDAQTFQLWHNGIEVPIYTSAATGNLGSAGYLEFYGEKNDGKADKALYRNPFNQLTDKVSLFTDTTVYFLTVNNTSANKRYQTIANDLSGTLPSPSPYVWANVRHDYINSYTGLPNVNKGEAANYGEYVYSSSFEKGEMMSSEEIIPDQGGSEYTNKKAVFNNLLPYTGGGLNAKLKISIAGAAQFTRDVRIKLNSTLLGDKKFANFDARVDSFTSIAPSLLNSTATISVQNLNANLFDRVVAGFTEIDYPRLPNAGNQTSHPDTAWHGG